MNKNQIIDKRFAWAEINLAHLSHNLKIIRSFTASKDTKVMAIVKADAYGHGAVEVSRRAIKCGVDALGVAIDEEGVGINFKDAVSKILKIFSLPNLKLEAISTHFSCAGSRDDYYTEQQW